MRSSLKREREGQKRQRQRPGGTEKRCVDDEKEEKSRARCVKKREDEE